MRLFLPICVLLGAAVAFPAPSPNPTLKSLLGEIRLEVEPTQAMDFVEHVYPNDRWFTFPKFIETTEYLQSTTVRIGLKRVERLGAPADGVSQFGCWTEPLAWDATEGRLEVLDPAVPVGERVLADYQKVPCLLCMWSGSTPPGGVTAEVVELKGTKPDAIARMDLRGKLVLTAQVPSDIKWALAKAGALGAINTYTENSNLLDGRQWINAWGDNGWAFTKGSAPLLCFSISPREANLVRRLLAEHGSIRVRAIVKSRYYKGIYPSVTGVIPGTGREEVLTLGHNAEQGAEDNATGVSAMLEAAATLDRLIASGRLPHPKRSIRILAMPEMYGSMHYIATHPDRMRRTIAAFTVDTPAGPYDTAGTDYTFVLDPQVASSYADALISKLAEDYFPSIDLGFRDYYIRKFGRPWHVHPFRTWSDNYLSDPAIGVADIAISSDSGVETHHNSEDTPDRIDPRSLRDISVVDAAFLYYLANAGKTEAVWLAQLSETHADRMILNSVEASLDGIAAANNARRLAGLWEGGIEKIDFEVGRGVQAVNSTERLVPESNRAGYRPLSEVIRLTQMERGPVNFDFVGYFRFLRKHGYVEFVKGN